MRRVFVAAVLGALMFVACTAMRDVSAGAAVEIEDSDHLLDGVPGLGGPKR